MMQHLLGFGSIGLFGGDFETAVPVGAGFTGAGMGANT